MTILKKILTTFIEIFDHFHQKILTTLFKQASAAHSSPTKTLSKFYYLHSLSTSHLIAQGALRSQ
jgi:hypothetical protein